ncbi:MAG: arylsulfatase [Labilibaculum sp.]|nr:arylsulfatase [Labilibaculum sp.]
MIHYLNSKLIGMAALTFLSVNQQAIAQKVESKQRPNILLILADDMGYSDLGCYGSEIKTPNLDRLADNGVRMTQFYNAARCCPSRASLLTGLYQHQAGVGHMDKDIGTPAYQGYINKTSVTLAEALKVNGYNTYHVGKWHVGEEFENWPIERGFNRAWGPVGGSINYFKPKPRKVIALDNNRWFAPDSGFYMTNAMGDFAISFLDEEVDKPEPFFMYLAFTAPHWPLQALPEDIAKYQGKYMQGFEEIRKQRFERMKKLGVIDRNTKLSPLDQDSPDWDSLSQEEKKRWDLRMAVYAAMLDNMDQNIGRVIVKLEKMDELDNTLIIFLSDNGGCAERINFKERNELSSETGTPESFDSYEYPWANVSNTPFRQYKKWSHEGGVSTPLIAWWNGKIKPQINRTSGHIIDLMPTLIDVAGGAYPKEYNGNAITQEEGISLLPLFEGENMKDTRLLFWEHEGNAAVRDGKWKLVKEYNIDKWELYNIDEDRSELDDLSEKYPKKVQELIAKWNEWSDRVGVRPFKGSYR